MSRQNSTFVEHPERGIRMHYHRLGSGSDILLAFHGFGRDARQFGHMAELVGKQYTILSFDLFFHGHSSFEKLSPEQIEKGLSKTDLHLLIETLCRQERIDRFSLAGFSIGARFALCLTELFPEKVQNIFLFAPDGLEEHYLHRFATTHLLGKYLFRKTMHNPQFLNRVLDRLKKLKVLDGRSAGFVRYYLDDPDLRMRLYNTWIFLRYIKAVPSVVQRIINSRQIKLRIFMGRYDRIIRLQGGQRFIRNIKNGELVIADTGHSLMSRHILRTFDLS